MFIVLLLLPWRAAPWLLVAAGGLLFACGTIVLIAAARRLGTALTPTPVPIHGAGLRTGGLYARVRHPIYSGVLLATLGYLIALGSAWSWAWGALILVFFVVKSRWEDRLLHEEYGEVWQEWASATGGLVPRLLQRRAS